MPLIKARTNRVRSVRHICRLAEPMRDVLVHYARFIGDTPDYVLNTLIETTIAKDRDFVTWRAEQTPETAGSSFHARPATPEPARTEADADTREAHTAAATQTRTDARSLTTV